MAYFMINVTTETEFKEANYEVGAWTSMGAVIRLMVHLWDNGERLIHTIHVGAPYEQPVSDVEAATWAAEDQFKQLH